MVQLEDAGESAKVCARCHHITDAQLLAAGHKSGTDFDFAAALEKIRHWQGQSKAAPELQQAYEKTQ